MVGIRNRKYPKEILEENLIYKPQESQKVWTGARYLRRSPRIIQFATKVTVEFDEKIRNLADEERIYLAEALEKCLESYLYCKDKGINIERERERDKKSKKQPKK